MGSGIPLPEERHIATMKDSWPTDASPWLRECRCTCGNGCGGVLQGLVELHAYDGGPLASFVSLAGGLGAGTGSGDCPDQGSALSWCAVDAAGATQCCGPVLNVGQSVDVVGVLVPVAVICDRKRDRVLADIDSDADLSGAGMSDGVAQSFRDDRHQVFDHSI